MALDDGAAPSTRAVSGLVSVGGGLAVYGLATYGFLAAAGRGLPATDFTPLSVMWTVLNAVGIGLFVPFEQELSRRTAVARATRAGNASVVRHVARAAVVVLVVVAVVAALVARPVAAHLFAGRGGLVALLVAAMAGMAASYVARGLLSGNGRFGRYGAQLATDGVLRVAGAAVLAGLGVRGPEPYAVVLVLSPVLAVLATTPRPGRLLTPGPPVPPAGATTALATLVAASALSQVLANAGPIIVQLVAGPGEATAAGQFTAALVVARVPLFAFAAVQAVLLPGLAAFVGARDSQGLRTRARLVAMWTGALGAVGTVAVWLLGPWLVRLLFGADFITGRGVITAIAASGAAFMLAQVAAQVLLALGNERV
ncbi:MAG TPA: hypothetical protein VGC04_13645, partial [Cellulomonas sp.]